MCWSVCKLSCLFDIENNFTFQSTTSEVLINLPLFFLLFCYMHISKDVMLYTTDNEYQTFSQAWLPFSSCFKFHFTCLKRRLWWPFFNLYFIYIYINTHTHTHTHTYIYIYTVNSATKKCSCMIQWNSWIIELVYFIVKQPPSQMKICLTNSNRNIHKWGNVLKLYSRYVKSRLASSFFTFSRVLLQKFSHRWQNKTDLYLVS